MIHIYVRNLNHNNLVNKTKKHEIYRYRVQSSSYQLGGWGGAIQGKSMGGRNPGCRKHIVQHMIILPIFYKLEMESNF